MKGALLSVVVAISFVSIAPPLAAQPAAARVANPETVEFEVPPDEQDTVNSYRVELFVSGSDTSTAVPVKILDLFALKRDNGGPIRIDIRSALEGVADGEYVATIRTVRADRNSPRSRPTAPFVISGYAVARESVLTAPSQQGVAAAPALTEDEKRRERFWTKIGVAVGAAAFLLPFVFP